MTVRSCFYIHAWEIIIEQYKSRAISLQKNILNFNILSTYFYFGNIFNAGLLLVIIFDLTGKNHISVIHDAG